MTVAMAGGGPGVHSMLVGQVIAVVVVFVVVVVAEGSFEIAGWFALLVGQINCLHYL